MKTIRMKRFLLFLANCLLPLAVGLAYYIVRRPDTRITQVVGHTLGFQTRFPLLAVKNQVLTLFDNYLSDFLWAYALTFSVHTAALFAPRLELRSFLLCLLGACFVEVMQLVPSFGGVFDVIDIVVQLAAVLIAKGLIIQMKRGVYKNVSEQTG